MTTPSCSDCGAQVADPAERWPDSADGTLCQVCWETHCSREWWAVVTPLLGVEALTLPDWEPRWRAAISNGPVEHNGTGFWAVYQGELLPLEDPSPATEQAA